MVMNVQYVQDIMEELDVPLSLSAHVALISRVKSLAK
jgi:hypothetical protein